MKKNFVAKVVAGHRITIPKGVCQVLQIEEGDLVDVDIKRIDVERIHVHTLVQSEVEGRTG